MEYGNSNGQQKGVDQGRHRIFKKILQKGHKLLRPLDLNSYSFKLLQHLFLKEGHLLKFEAQLYKIKMMSEKGFELKFQRQFD